MRETFPFLIGKVLTVDEMDQEDDINVSIPYR